MATNTLKVLHKQAVKTEAAWSSSNPIIPNGVMAFSSDKNGAYKLGNGTAKWKELKYSNDTVTYTITKNGATVTLTGSDGSSSSFTDSDTKYSAITESEILSIFSQEDK